MKQITFRLKPGQLLKEEIKKKVADNNITAGVLLCCVGSLENAVLRTADATSQKQPVKDVTGPFEIVSGTGTISKEGCHLHITVSDKEGKTLGGHLKNGCRVNTTAEIVIGVFEDATYKRIIDDKTGFKELLVE